MDTPIPGKPIDNWDVMQRAFDKWPWVASGLRGVSHTATPDDFDRTPRPLSTLFDVTGLDERLYLWVAGCRIHECSMQDLIGYRLDIEVHESELTYVFATDYTWFGIISDEDKIFLHGDWGPAKRK